ncbi:MAG: methyltransferase domain-containing protein [Bacteroidetes bacterium]|nr:methyltransferase domain-containing protein [Bacteroidota bacterium]
MRKQLKLFHWIDVFKRLSGRGIYPHELAFMLDSPIRKFILSPEKLIQRLHLSPNSIVLEIGPGPGYFSLEVAKRIPAGQLILFDIQSEMLNKSIVKLKKENIKNFYAVQGNAIVLPFNSRVFDIIFLVTVLGEVTDQEKCLNSINRILRVGGILSITEMSGDPDVLSQDEIHQKVSRCGFEYVETFPSFKGFTINFKKIH